MPNSALGKLARLDSTSGNGPFEYVASKDLAQGGCIHVCKHGEGGWVGVGFSHMSNGNKIWHWCVMDQRSQILINFGCQWPSRDLTSVLLRPERTIDIYISHVLCIYMYSLTTTLDFAALVCHGSTLTDSY